jgi:hypothetical protein
MLSATLWPSTPPSVLPALPFVCKCWQVVLVFCATIHVGSFDYYVSINSTATSSPARALMAETCSSF